MRTIPELLNCKKCCWYEKHNKFCRYYEQDIENIIGACLGYKIKMVKRDCTKCVHFDTRINAKQKCKIGIYNCKSVIKKERL